MAEAALSIARRILAGPSGACGAADSLERAAETDINAAADTRLWAAVAYLRKQANQPDRARRALRVAERLRETQNKKGYALGAENGCNEHTAKLPVEEHLFSKEIELTLQRKAEKISEHFAKLAVLRQTGQKLFSAPVYTDMSHTVPRDGRVHALSRQLAFLRKRGAVLTQAVQNERNAESACSARLEEALAQSEQEDTEEDEEDYLQPEYGEEEFQSEYSGEDVSESEYTGSNDDDDEEEEEEEEEGHSEVGYSNRVLDTSIPRPDIKGHIFHVGSMHHSIREQHSDTTSTGSSDS